MSITRRKPATEKEVQIALFRAKQQMGIVPAGEQALSAAQQTQVTDENTAFGVLRAAEVSKKYVMVTGTVSKDAAKDSGRNFVNGYFQSYNIGINLLKKFDKESRVFYTIAINDNRVPVMSSEADILYWGDKVATGDAARVAAGGTAMSNPTAAEVATKIGDFNTKNTAQGLKVTDYGTAQANTTAEMPNAIKLVTKVWDCAETLWDGLTIEAKRVKCRPWGVVYESTEKMTINVTVKNKTTGMPLAGAVTTVLENGTEHISDAAGNEVIETNIALGVTLETALDMFVTNSVTIDFITGTSVYNVVVEMVPV